MKNYSLLITSCDSFEDTWYPFFKLYQKNWDDKFLPIYLITENKQYNYPNINIVSTCVGSNPIMTWSQTVIESIKKVKTDFILLHLDDCFIKDTVDIAIIDKVATRLQEDASIGAIYLTLSGPKNCKSNMDDGIFSTVNQFSQYKVSTMSCLWRKDVLLSLLKERENAWMFELYGTKRAQLKKYRFFKINNIESEPIRYVNTGITKGKWNKEVVDIFNQNDIDMDFEKRGFFEITNRWLIKWTTFKTLMKNPFTFFYHYIMIPPTARIKYLFFD
jgi:hypothetical protein